jgi:hypothetical protein
MRFCFARTRTMATAILSVLLAAACTPSGTASLGATASPRATAPGPDASPSPTASLAIASTKPSGQGDSPVTIAAEQERFAPGVPIHLEIRNGLNDPITTVDQQAFCGVLRLDQEIAPDVWEEVHNCASGPPPRDVVIGPGQLQAVTWETGLGKGVYRARLVYTVGEAFVAGEASEVTTGRLTVG